MKSKRSPNISKPPRLRVGLKDVSREQFAEAAQEKLGKQRVSIMLDASVIAFFKAKAGDRGYQTRSIRRCTARCRASRSRRRCGG